MKKSLAAVIAILLINSGCASESLQVYVSDSEGNTVSNARVVVSVPETTHFWGSNSRSYKSDRHESLTDSNGVATVRFNCKNFMFYWSVDMDGFYRSDVHTEKFKDFDELYIPPATPKVVLHEHEKTGSVVLYKKKNPQPMYAYGMYESLKIRWPRENGRYGFDLRLFDWVAPKGKGEVADFYFVRNVVDGKPGECVGHLEFDDKCGAYVRKQTGSKSFPSTYGAETNAVFTSRFQFMFLNDKGGISYGTIIGEDEYMVLRTRVKCDDKGNIKEANYSKILGPFGKGKGGVETMETVFNPRVNDPNLELDSPKNFVKRNRSCAYPP